MASALALVEYNHGRSDWRTRDVSWWIVSINMLGSVAFGISTIYAIVLPGTGDVLDVWGVNAWTLLGAICFLIGAYLLLPELRRNIGRVVAAAPSS
jgi:TM2 domain-containing membrane protein YozV